MYDVDFVSIILKIFKDGYLIIEVIRKIVKIEDDFLFGGFEMCVGEVVWIDEKKFSVLLDVINFVFEA